MNPPTLRHLGLRDYEKTWREMQDFTASRTKDTRDEIWLLEHPPVFTLGLNGKREHLLAPGDIPIVNCDRGGQVTYHGPGQLIAYLLLDLKRRGLGVKEMVRHMEQVVIDLLSDYGIDAERRAGAPGIYVEEKRSLPSACACAAVAAITASASMWTWTWHPFRASIPVATRDWKPPSCASCGPTSSPRRPPMNCCNSC